eukprot:NODE_90_length_21577_cov_0.697691.p15 type:complete len:119 gc:universal NODE_90_length_21577_cov_0.697691:6952-6596(-)
MGKPQSRKKKTGASIRAVYKRNKTKRRTMDIDQISERLQNKPKAIEGYKDLEKVGMGEYPCVECDRCFLDQFTLEKHTKGKPHKRRLKQIKEGAYTQKEAELAVGLATENFKNDSMTS